MRCSRRLIVQTLVFSHSHLHRQVSPPETVVVKGGTAWARNGRWILPENARLPGNIQGSSTCRKSTTWDFTSLPKEGVLRIFSPWKFRRLRSGLNTRTWVPNVSTLPLDPRSCSEEVHTLGFAEISESVVLKHVIPFEILLPQDALHYAVHTRPSRLWTLGMALRSKSTGIL